MENIDDPEEDELQKYALVRFDNFIVEIEKLEGKHIRVNCKELGHFSIDDGTWSPIFLDKQWLKELNFPDDGVFKNPANGKAWILRKAGKYHFLTTLLNPTPGRRRPIIPVHMVHDLQYFYHAITGKHLRWKGEEPDEKLTH